MCGRLTVIESVFIWCNACFIPWDAFIMILGGAGRTQFPSVREGLFCVCQGTFQYWLQTMRSHLDMTVASKCPSDPFTSVSSKLLVKCVQKKIDTAVSELKNPRCLAKASAWRWQKFQARLTNAKAFRETVCTAIYLFKLFLYIGKPGKWKWVTWGKTKLTFKTGG